MQYSVTFPGGSVRYLFNGSFEHISQWLNPRECIIITDSHVNGLYNQLFTDFKAVITIPAGEEHKNFSTILSITQQLLEHQAHRKTTLLGVGGGMATDITGFIASVYMRGMPFGYVPTSLLGMVDAAIGGKNGVNIGLQKNLLGTIAQPKFILFDTAFLGTLPGTEWSNGFAEVIKYACLFDKELFTELAERDIQYYKKDNAVTSALIARCADWKNKIVLADERESGMRKLLNFGHTAGHAFETVCLIPHGHAVALGMLVACRLSAQYGMSETVTGQLQNLLQQYSLPTTIQADTDELMRVLTMDKKRDGDGVDFILLKEIGKADIHNIAFNNVRQALASFIHAGNH
ncbi:MAG: 3-dehydroquinate synthase [Taibaiella sp.]|nr:3-dehydroquinate synthase [Taibaiella sp.]